MKIVLTVHQFLPEYSSGTEILTYETAKDLQKRGHEVRIFTAVPTQDELTDDRRFGSYTYDGLPVEYFSYNRQPMGKQTNPFEMEFNNLLVKSHFKKYLKQEKPDIVHFFHLAHISSTPIDACVELGIPTVYAPTDFWFICPMYQLMYPGNQICPGPDKFATNCMRHFAASSRSRRIRSISQRIPGHILRFFIFLAKKLGTFEKKYSPLVYTLSERQPFLQKKINLIDRVIIPTRIMRANLLKYGLDEQRTIHIPFGINTQYIKNAPRTTSDKMLRLGFIGTLNEHKGAHVLVKAMKRLEGKPVTLKIFGKINEKQGYTRRLIRMSEGDSRIEFCGTFPNTEIGNVFSELDVLVVPSLWHENSPLVIYSAQLAGCPVIASNMAGMAEVVRHGENGLLFDAGNDLKLAEAINSILEKPELLRGFSEKAPRPLSIQEYVDRLLEVYKPLLKSGVEV
jgi:glycosyltransferase involved in cell wall biosynthesis